MPEGDTIHRAAIRLGRAVTGHDLVELSLPRLATPGPPPGTTVGAVEARGKHLLVHFGDGHVLHTHLRMNGSWSVRASSGPPPRGRAVLTVEHVVAVCARAPVVELLDEPAVRRHPRLRRLGPDLTVPWVDLDDAVSRCNRMATEGRPIGDLLLDQRPACGIGNVIMQETCFLEGLDPRSPVEHVDLATRTALYATAARLLRDNVHTTRRTTVPGGRPGTLYVYDRARRACRRCGDHIEVGRPGRDARPTWWCPGCQRLR